MASKKIRDLVVKVGEYQDRNTGQTKGRFENIGALMEGEGQNGEKSLFIMLKRTFNPAGVPGQDARESILVSCYVPQDQRGGDDRGQGASSGYSQGGGQSQGGSGYGGGGRPDMDDEIPL